MTTIIGKRYEAIDNSWGINLSDPVLNGYENNPRLAGTYNTPATGATIITEPFTINVKSPVRPDMLERKFIIVAIDGTNQHAMVLYFAHAVKEPIKSDYFEDITIL